MNVTVPASPFASRSARLLWHLLDRGAWLLGRLDSSRGRLVPGELMERAESRTGLQSWGEDDFREGLRVLTDACNRARTGPLGRAVVRAECERILSNRLRIQRAREKLPRLEDVPIRQPIFIVGLPRTGTTAVHHLLSALPGHRGPTLYRMLDSAAALEPQGRGAPRRLRRVIRWLHAINPEFEHIRDVRLEDPEECLFLLQHSFSSMVLGLALDVPRYIAWLVEKDMGPAYAYHRIQLQLLGLQDPAPRWVLKSPLHTYFLEALVDEYPDALIVYMHRDPVTALASLCSLRESLARMVSRDVDPHTIGSRTLWAVRTQAARGMAGHDAIRRPVIHLHLEQIVREPEVAFAPLLKALSDIDLSPAQLAARWRASQPSSRRRHRYDLRRYGLDPEEVAETFARYRSWELQSGNRIW